MERRSTAVATAPEEFLRGSQAKAPFDRSAVEQAPADALSDEETSERAWHAEDASGNEPALAADLYLHPRPRRSAAIARLGVLRNEPFVTPLFHDRPRGVAVVGQPASGEHHACARDLLLEHVSAAVQRQSADVEPVNVQAIECHEEPLVHRG